jgi:uncharacterized protein YhhL (DUF1145 family)
MSPFLMFFNASSFASVLSAFLVIMHMTIVAVKSILADAQKLTVVEKSG